MTRASAEILSPSARSITSPGTRSSAENLLLLAIANHRGIGRQHLLERLGRLARTRLLPEAEHAVDDVHEPHCDAKLREPRDERDGARDPQKHRHEVCEVREERDDGRLLLLALDDVFSEAPLAYGSLVRGESRARRLKLAEHAVDGVPCGWHRAHPDPLLRRMPGAPDPKLLPMKPLLP